MRFFRSYFVWIATAIFTTFYFLMPNLAQWITSDPTYAKYAGREADKIVQIIQVYWVYPFGKWLPTIVRHLIVLPYWLLFFTFLRFTFSRYKKGWKIVGIATIAVLFLLYLFPNLLMIFENKTPSIAHGTVGNGRVEQAKRVNFRGKNFTTYSFPGYLAGRTFAHNRVKETILGAYQICQETCPETTFVLGEIGTRHGGRFLPHRTHRNGLSVDFMTPLRKKGKAYRAHSIFKIWGYAWEFDHQGKAGTVEIDYETMARHLLALEQAAKQNGLRIQKVIFDPVLRPFLLATPTGKKIGHLPYTKNRVIVRHDDHYHVDFAVLK